MENRNPLIPAHPTKKFITMGEIMLRLTPPNYDKIRVANSFEVSFDVITGCSKITRQYLPRVCRMYSLI